MPLGLLFIIAGVVLVTAGSSWFAGAATVGVILIAAPIVLTLIGLLIAALFFSKGADALDRMDRRWG